MGGYREDLREKVHDGDLVRRLGGDNGLGLLLEHREEARDQLV